MRFKDDIEAYFWAFDIHTYARMEAWLSAPWATPRCKEIALKRMHEISAKYPSAKLKPPSLEN